MSTDEGALLRFEKLTLRGTHFLKKVALIGIEIPKFSQNLLLFSQNFYKKVLYEGLIFYFGVFATLPRTREGETATVVSTVLLRINARGVYYFF